MLLSDYKTGFGGQYGVQNDRQDKSAVGWDHQEKLQKHESQKGEWQLNWILGKNELNKGKTVHLSWSFIIVWFCRL